MDSITITAIAAVVTAIATGVMIWAVYVAPQKAFEAQWQLQLKHEAQKQRMHVFTTLMATRGNILHHRHVEALNLIDVEFSEAAEKDIRDAWKAYLDDLTTPLPEEPDQAKREARNLQQQERRKDLLAELLHKMSSRLGYKFDFTYLKTRAYYPQGHGALVEEQEAIRKGLIQMLWKGKPLVVTAIDPHSIDKPNA